MQKGHVFQRGQSWVVKYWETVLENGEPKRRKVLKRVAAVSDDYPNPQSVDKLVADILAPVNSQRRPETTEKLSDFLELVYMPACKKELRPSTYGGYLDLMRLVTPHLNGQRLRDIRTSDIDALLRAVANEPTKKRTPRAHTTMLNVRNFLSGAFRFAIRSDRYNYGNPAREARLPKGLKRMEDTYAYSLKEIEGMLKALPEPERTIVATAAFSGFRLSELRGLRWQDYTGETLRVERSVWGSHVGETKTEKSRGDVPVIPLLKKALDAHKRRSLALNGYIFEGGTGKPLVLPNVARRTIRPALEKARIQWHGWHAFRRGLSTNLHDLGVDDLTIQKIMRHDDVATTQAHYIKTRDSRTRQAMRKLEAAFNKRK